jgi:HPt (histidine-containing phosphotransfer) domain-containing protein
MNEPRRPLLFDADVLADTASGDSALQQELVEIFLRTVPPMASRLRQALQTSQFILIAEETHRLRSCLAMIGATNLNTRCLALEIAARCSIGETMDDALCTDIEWLIGDVRAYHAASLRNIAR